MRRLAIWALFGVVLFTAKTYAQSSYATVSGFVQDSSQAFIPGVTVTATNTQTGVAATAVTNESGTYTIPSLLPGTYRLSAELPGFKTQVINEVQLGQSASARYNFTLQVGAVTDSVEVTAESTALIAETAATIGQVLSQKKVQDLPLVSNNVLDLMQTMAGVRGATLGESTTFAGVSTSMVNTVRDGLSVQDGRYANGVGATTQVHPDMVGEFRVILSPVDAELGRGNGQVQILTRSGTNQFHGSALWNNRNSKLDANTWQNNKQVVNGKWSPAQPAWINRNQLTGSVGGPIIKNKTFFFALWDQQIERQRFTARPVVLTDCARNGIFRYWEGWGNGNTLQVTTPTGGNPTIASVDSFGNPVRPATNPNGTPYSGQLRYFSIFGPVVNTPTKPDCSDAVVSGAPWDTNRTAMDPAGITQKYLSVMPHANRFDGGDGLNTAVNQWVYRGHNNANFGLASGTSTDTDRKQINTKIDHNINSRNKVALNYSYEWVDGNYLAAATSAWPGVFPSQVVRRPRVLTVNYTSTLTSSLLNEARFGYRANQHVIWAPWEVTDEKAREVPKSLLLSGQGGYPISYAPSAVGAMSINNYSCQTNCAQQGNRTPLFDYADTLSWTHGKHAFKGGADVRFTYTRGSETPTPTIARATGGGQASLPATAFASTTNFVGLIPNNQTTAQNLLYFLSGSVASATQIYFIQSPDHQNKWMSYFDRSRKINEPHQNELSLFFKDDWKVRPSLTLNLGLRYEYYGVPYEGQGLSIIPKNGGGLALFGVSGRSFDKWMRPNNGVNLDLVTDLEFVGPKTSQPDKSIYPNDWNNFGPAIGFAWELPWFGKGKTNVRGGYQVSFVGGGHAGQLSNFIFATPGFTNPAQTAGPLDGSYFNTAVLPGLVPIQPNSLPMQPIPILKQSGNAAAFDPNYVTPYIQNFTLSVTREITRNLSLDVRYIGTRGVKLNGFFDLNSPDVFYNPALFDAFERTRRGEDVELFDQIFMGLSLVTGRAAVNGTTQRGSEHLRLNTTFRDALANGDFATAANLLNYFNGFGTGATGVVTGVAGERGTVLKRANLGINVPGGATVAGASSVPAGLFPSNWISANPQFNQANYYTNSGSSNYHSLQVQGTLRPTSGLSFQGTYVWSRSLETPLNGSNIANGLQTAPTYTNPTERNKDYALSPNHVTHDFRTNGTFELPLGPGKLLLRNSSGWMARVVEGWATSFIVNLSTGQPVSVGAANMLYAGGVPDVVGDFPVKGFGQVKWNGDYGNFFGDQFGSVADPQCGVVADSLKSLCTLKAVTDKSGKILLQNPLPGRRGTLGRQTLEMPGSWSFDAAMSKTIRLAEAKSLVIRMDSTNVFNHPVPNAPVLNINATNPFGFIQDKGNQIRQFKANLRFVF
jgi:hypothetical protein